MIKRNSSTEERLLAERLRREALQSRPAFSESLHQRIVAAVKLRHAAQTAVANMPAASRRWPRGRAAALAAACLLCAMVIGSQLMKDTTQRDHVEGVPPTSTASIADLPSIDYLADHTVGKLDGLTVSAALEPQATHLKHDARAVASVFLDRLPLDAKLVNNP